MTETTIVDGSISDIENIIEEAKKVIWNYLCEVEPSEAPDMSEIDNDGSISTDIIDAIVPVYDEEIDAIWYFHASELEESYDRMSAIYDWYYAKFFEWYEESKESLFAEWNMKMCLKEMVSELNHLRFYSCLREFCEEIYEQDMEEWYDEDTDKYAPIEKVMPLFDTLKDFNVVRDRIEILDQFLVNKGDGYIYSWTVFNTSAFEDNFPLVFAGTLEYPLEISFPDVEDFERDYTVRFNAEAEQWETSAKLSSFDAQ